METKPTSPAVKGIMISLVLIIISLVVQFLDLTQNKAISSIGILLFFAGIIWSDITYAKQLNGNVTFGNVFSDGFKTSAAVAAIMVVFTIISFKILFPESIDKILEQSRLDMAKDNKLSDDQIETAISMTKKFFIPFAIGGSIVMYLLGGVIASLIGAAVAKKNPSDPFTQQG